MRLTGEGFWGSRQKTSLVGLTPMTWTTETSKEGPFQSQPPLTAKSLSEHSNTQIAASGIRTVEVSHSDTLFFKKKQGNKTKTGKNANGNKGNTVHVKP